MDAQPNSSRGRISAAWAEAWEEGALLFIKVLRASFEAASIVLFLGIHWGLNRAVQSLLAVESLPKTKTVLEAIFLAAFIAVYTHQAYDMVVIFWPSLRHLSTKEQSHDSSHA
jgi:hypothetical protein